MPPRAIGRTADFVALIRSVSEEDLAQPARFSDQEPRSLAAQIMGNGFEHPVVHYADYYQRRGDLAKAMQMYEASVAAVADLPEWYGSARYNLACFYALSGQADQAIPELREAAATAARFAGMVKAGYRSCFAARHAAYQALYAA